MASATSARHEASPAAAAATLVLEVLENRSPGCIHDVFGRIEHCSCRSVFEPGGIRRSRWSHERSMSPPHIGHSAFITRTALRTPPRRIRCEIETTTPNRLPTRVGTALEMLALLAHGHMCRGYRPRRDGSRRRNAGNLGNLRMAPITIRPIGTDRRDISRPSPPSAVRSVATIPRHIPWAGSESPAR